MQTCTAAHLFTMTLEQIYLQKETSEALDAGLNKCGPRGREYLLYRYGFVDGQEHSETETARRYHLKRSQARRLEEDSISILQSHLIICGECRGNAKEELMKVGWILILYPIIRLLRSRSLEKCKIYRSVYQAKCVEKCRF